MIKLERTSVMNFENAIRGARNPMNSWNKMDSVHCQKEQMICCPKDPVKCPKDGNWDEDWFCIGKNDMALLKRLRKAGPDHRKFMRQIFVSVDILAPLYWWKEMDQYRVAVVSNSCSTMHKIHAKEFTLDDFSHEYLFDSSMCELESVIERMNFWRTKFIIQSNKETADENYATAKQCWWQMIQLLPSSYNQLRTVTMNYETLVNIYHARKNHKLDEWHELCDWIKTLPYAKELIVCE